MRGMVGDGGELTTDAITRDIIAAIIEVHRVLGPGFLEGIYRRALMLELRKRNLRVGTEVEVEILYDGTTVGQHRLDLLIEDMVIVELKTVEGLSRAHYAQVRSYLKATGKPVALLVNFAGERADYRRIG
jgi:GxxExxY protein